MRVYLVADRPRLQNRSISGALPGRPSTSLAVSDEANGEAFGGGDGNLELRSLT
jgi:hypothetical protein